MSSSMQGFPARYVPSHELVDHTSEITIRLRAPSFAALLAEATQAFGDLVPAEARDLAHDKWREFRVQGSDRVAELVAWLNEVVYLCDAEQWLPVDVEIVREDPAGLVVRAKGARLAAPFVRVKAATLHGAEVRESPSGIDGEVTLDV